MMQVLDSQKRGLLEHLYRLPVVTETPRITYVSLYTGFDFFDLDPLCNDSIARSEIVNIYVDMIEQLKKRVGFNKLVFVDKQGRGGVGPLVLTSEIGTRLGLETVVVRSGVRCKCAVCSRLAVRGASLKPLSSEDKVVIITDVITAGSTVRDILGIIQNEGAKPVGIVAFLDREFEQNGKKAVDHFKEKGISVISYMKRSELIYLGFDTPTGEEVLSRDYVSEISAYLGLLKQEQKKFIGDVEELVDGLLREQKIELTSEQKRAFLNIYLTLAMRTKKNVISLLG